MGDPQWAHLRELKRELGESLDEFSALLRRRANGEDVGEELERVARQQQDLNARVQEYVSADPATTKAAREAAARQGWDR